MKSSRLVPRFWDTKPVCTGTQVSIVKDVVTLKSGIEVEMAAFPHKLGYDVVDTNDTSQIARVFSFMNDNYHHSNDHHRFAYSADLFSYYLGSGFQAPLVLRFFATSSPDVTVACVVGKPTYVSAHGTRLCLVEINFLCLISQLRSIGLSGYVINAVTKETLQRYDGRIAGALYTTVKPLSIPSFCTKRYYHRPLRIQHLLTHNFLLPNTDANVFCKVFNSFSYVPADMAGKRVKRIGVDLPQEEIVKVLQSMYDAHAKEHYDVFESVEIRGCVQCPSMYVLVIENTTSGAIDDFLVLYRLDMMSSRTGGIVRNMFLYVTCVRPGVTQSVLEAVAEYLYVNDVCDVITLSDIYDTQGNGGYMSLKYIEGSAKLDYYLYNYTAVPTQPHRTGLVTV